MVWTGIDKDWGRKCLNFDAISAASYIFSVKRTPRTPPLQSFEVLTVWVLNIALTTIGTESLSSQGPGRKCLGKVRSPCPASRGLRTERRSRKWKLGRWSSALRRLPGSEKFGFSFPVSCMDVTGFDYQALPNIKAGQSLPAWISLSAISENFSEEWYDIKAH